MFKKLQHKNFEKRIERALKKRDRSGLNNAVKTIGIVYDGDDIHEIHYFNKLISLLNISEENISYLGFVTNDKKNASLPKHICTKKDFTWFGEIKSAEIKQFTNKKLDVIVGYYNKSDNYLDIIVAQSAARFKIGLANADERLFDLIVSVDPKESVKCNAEIVKYLRILGKL